MAVSNIKKNAKGYGYTYTDLAQIHEQLEALGWTYYQYIETSNGEDYIYTVLIIDGKEQPARRGCKVIETSPGGKANPAQAYGSGLTYARRYSLLMACGFATTDDDAQTLDGTAKKPKKSAKVSAERRTKEEIIKSLANEVGFEVPKICATKGKTALEEFTDEELGKILTWLEGKKNA